MSPTPDSTISSRPTGEHVVLTLVPTGKGPPFQVRVRSLLKRALRAYGLRCVGIAGKIGEEAGKPIGAAPEGTQAAPEASEAKSPAGLPGLGEIDETA